MEKSYITLVYYKFNDINDYNSIRLVSCRKIPYYSMKPA